MNIKGTITYCDGCGFKIFRKGEIKYDPLVYACIWSDIDPLPDGWKEFNGEHLCPICAKAWEETVKPVRRNDA